MTSPKHFLDLDRLDKGTLRGILDQGADYKKDRARADGVLAGKVLALIFEKPSTRTRVSFDVAMRQLGGQTLFLSEGDSQLGRGETIADTARVLSRYVDAIMIRTDAPEKLEALADNASVPVINGLTDRTHPCQLMADVMTFEEHRGPDSRPHGRLGRRRQQRRGELDPGRGAVRFRAASRLPAGAQAGSRYRFMGAEEGRRYQP